jgi:hypothetical protein
MDLFGLNFHGVGYTLEDSELTFKHVRCLLEDKIVRSHGKNTLQELGQNHHI